MNISQYFVYLLPALTCAFIIYYFYQYVKDTHRPKNILDLIEKRPAPSFPRVKRLNKQDFILIAALTIIYALVAFTNLGDMTNPQTFYRFKTGKISVIIDMASEHQITKIAHYTGNWHSDDGYTFETSPDGVVWQEQGGLVQDYAKTFKWIIDTYEEPLDAVRYVKLTATKTPMELGEVAFYDLNGVMIDPSSFALTEGTGVLFDEADTIPEHSSYLNSTYFDEIYHGRTAYEHLNDIRPYENTHPPLGKILISIGIQLFGMTPFGWRFVGTLFGALMVPMMYIFVKNLFGKTSIAVIGTLFFSFDFMHFTQTRIATIDTYGVFFTIQMYLFMYYFISSSFEDKASKQLVPLALCGLSFGLGIASKWTAFYAAIGLVVLYVLYLVMEGRRLVLAGKTKLYLKRLAAIMGVSLMFFVVASAAIYYFSYIPYARGMGEPLSLKLVWENQTGMFNYHKGVDAAHSYSSRWWMWIFNIRPILYFLEYPAPGLRSSFGAFLNPVVCWAGLVAIISLLVKFIKDRKDYIGLFILIGYASQLLPWVAITRITFAYHYFPSMVFLVLALCWVANNFISEVPKKRALTYILCGLSVALFVLFYPALSGLTISERYADLFLGWLPSWPF